MVFKMLILLGFFTVQAGFIIHSDIHRSIVDRADYEPQKTVATRVGLRTIRRIFARKTR
jgi:hypothetical protein